MCAACELENVDMVGLILSYGATVNQRCGQGWTALHEAVSRNNTEICEILLRAGASINPPNTYSVTPLTVAAQRGQMRTLCYLMGKGTCFLPMNHSSFSRLGSPWKGYNGLIIPCRCRFEHADL